MFMNEWEIQTALDRHRGHAVLGPAVKFLWEFCREVNLHSDGWPYWSAPVKAATRLMTLIQHPETATHVELHKALTPIKSFYTRRGYKAGMQFPEVGLL